MTFIHKSKKPVLPWEGHKRIALHDESGTMHAGSNRMSNAHGIMSIHSRRNKPTGHSVLLARAEIESETGLIEVTAVPDRKKTGRFKTIEDAWFAMLESAMPYMTQTEAGLTSRLIEKARPAYAAARGIIARERIALTGNRWLQTIAELPHGTSLRRAVFISTSTGNAFIPALYGPDGEIMARLEQNDDGTTRSIYPNRRLKNVMHIPEKRFEDENEALLALAIAGRNCGSEPSGHELIEYMEALQEPLAEKGSFMTRFGFPPLLDPVFKIAAA